MINNIRYRLNILRKIALVPYLKIKIIATGDGNFLPLRKTRININKPSQIQIKSGNFILNAKWDENDPFYSMFSMRENAKLIVSDSFRIYTNARISIHENATLELGSGLINNSLSLACFKRIKIGNNVAMAENVTLVDSDSHQITSYKHNMSDSIEIGDNVWIGMNTTILKGVKVGDGSIIGAGTVLTKSVPNNSLVVGVPGKVIKKNVKWKL